ncbi:MAG: glycosyltransferase family 39 protein [Candidatus Levyibacteriota bacterium]
MPENEPQEKEINFRDLFIPLTNKKILWFIVIIGLIVFGNSLFNGFVWDDNTYIITNPEIHTFNIFQLFGLSMFNSGGYYRPIPAVYFSLLWNIFGNAAFFYHLSQILLHITNACLLFYFLKRFFDKKLTFFLTLIFLIHPVQVESVAYIGATQSELLFLTGLGALLLSSRKIVHWKSLLLMSLLLLLSFLTKETGFLFLFIILLYHILFNPSRFRLTLLYSLGSVAAYVFIRFVCERIPLVDAPK